ncbi:MAG: DoxX family protein [Methylovirgula sp.]
MSGNVEIRESMNWRAILFSTRAPRWSLLVRLLVGLVVFFLEGIQKLAFPEILGTGRFANIGIPYPEVMGPFVGSVETICGALIILGLLTRLAAIPLIIIVVVAIVSTKVPILLGHDFWIFHVQKLPRYGFWSVAHEARADFDMLLGSLYLLIEGAGTWSVDAALSRGARHSSQSHRDRPK